MSRTWFLNALTFALSVAAFPAMAQVPGEDVNARPDPTATCHVGVYRLGDGSWVDVAPAVNKGLRWRRPDGTMGRMTLNAEGLWFSTLATSNGHLR